IVVGLIGERGREVKEFIEHILGPEGRQRAVVVAAPADTPALLRLQGAAYATSIAEHFRDQGRHVLLIMDSLTRYAMAQREIALAIGFYTVLAEGDDQQDPIADAARAILDGHVVLARDLAEAGHYPAIDVEASISRAMTALVGPDTLARVRRFKQLYSRYQRNRDLVNVGAYVKGSDALLDLAIALHPRMAAFLQQDQHERATRTEGAQQLAALLDAPAGGAA
ncbi:MAG: flagellum-specific ATP synthase FliI, partial [Burkholderiales bacterium]|nr:flagellum-specific ATP synthase FliI [Burkholderiales bacterium]